MGHEKERTTEQSKTNQERHGREQAEKRRILMMEA